MTSIKEKAMKRLRGKEVGKVDRELVRKQALVKELITKPGWEILLDSYQKTIENLKNELANTSSLRVFKCMEIRSQIKAQQKMFSIMSTAQISMLVRQYAKE